MGDREINSETISSLKDSLKTIEQQMNATQEEVGKAANMIENLAHSKPEYFDADTDEKLSPTAKEAIQAIKGPLSAQKLTEFLMKDVLGKPTPPVLPIIKKYTKEVEKLREQALEIKNFVNQRHNNYMNDQRRLDVNLKKRIDTLSKNILKELEDAEKSGKKQQSMEKYVTRKTRSNLSDSSGFQNLPGSSRQ